jgi:phosphoribosylaminoimidazolecarboxamide formyltransferase / IMP cyclohydrolase
VTSRLAPQPGARPPGRQVGRALFSVSDKTGLAAFARFLAARGFSLLSTGGTAEYLKREGLRPATVESVTGFPSILGGRVKTLHPKIMGGILADPGLAEHRRDMKRHGIESIGLVAVNLYPFERAAAKRGATRKDLIENIDIGGVSLLRAAAKNHESVCVLCDPADYAPFMALWEKTGGNIPLAERERLAAKAFLHTARYDALIASVFSARAGETESPRGKVMALDLVSPLRYGENPHQMGALCAEPLSGEGGVARAKVLQGKELSFNNYFDADAAWRLACEFRETACAVVKHAIPCGAALGRNAAHAFRRAFDADPVSGFGGVVAFNRPVDEAAARELTKPFLEVVAAPSFTKGALQILAAKKNLRLLSCGKPAPPKKGTDAKRIGGGWLLQEWDSAPENEKTWRSATKKTPPAKQMEDLRFAWRVVKHVRSNAIVVAKGGATLGVGSGQTNRVDAARQALARAGKKAKGAALASDAFFPFRDTVDEAIKAGVAAIIQPGGSKRDGESVAACDGAGIAMVFTGRRHFRH